MAASALAGAALVVRPRRRGLAMGLAASLVAHAVLLAVMFEGPPAARPGSSPRGKGSARAAAVPAGIVYLSLAVRPEAPAGTRVVLAAAPVITAASSPAPRVRTKPRRGVPAAPPPDPSVATVAPPAQPAQEAVSGEVFALPTIAFAGTGGSSRRRASWRALPPDSAPPSSAMAANTAPAAPDAQAAPQREGMRAARHEAMREAARGQLVQVLTQQLAALPLPQRPSEAGRCEPDGEPPAPALRCDALTLPHDLPDGGAALAALLASYRALDARVRGAAVVWDEGRYKLDLR